MNILGNVGARMAAYVVLSFLSGAFGFISYSEHTGLLTIDVDAALTAGLSMASLAGVAGVFGISRKVPLDKR